MIIKESHKNPKVLQGAMDFLDAITLLQNVWKKDKDQIKTNNRTCYDCGTLNSSGYSYEEIKKKHMIIEICTCRVCSNVYYYDCYCCR